MDARASEVYSGPSPARSRAQAAESGGAPAPKWCRALTGIDQQSVGNRLLRSLPASDFALLAPRLEPVTLNLRETLAEPDQPIPFAYFPQNGITSILMGPERTTGVEIGIVGREGLIGTPLLLGADQTPHYVFVQLAGASWRIRSDDLRAALDDSPSLHRNLLRYVQALMIQLASTAHSNADYSIEERLARWLLMCHDRVEGDDIALTHEFLALMLSVRRAGVTVATHVLEGEKMIAAKRGLITILDRGALMEIAGNSYGIAEAEYERLVGAP